MVNQYQPNNDTWTEPKTPSIIIFTNTYPYGTGETFFESELPYLLALERPILLAPLYGEGIMRTVPSTPKAPVGIASPLLSFNPKDKSRLLLYGLFNFAPFFFALRDFFTQQIWQSRIKIWRFGTSFLLMRAIWAKNRRFFRRQEDALLYFYWADKAALILPFLSKEGKRGRTVVRFHGSDLYEEAKGFLPFRNRLFPAIELACPVSRHGADYLRQRYGALSPPVSVARLGTSDYGLGPDSIPDAPFHILSCANLIPLKRLHLIWEALLLLHREQSLPRPVCWTLIGGGPLRCSLEKAIRDANLAESLTVRLCGPLPHHAVMEFYKKTPVDLYMLTGRSEGVPVSIMEALSFGISVMATAVGGVPELVSEANGHLLPAHPKADHVAEALLNFMKLPLLERHAKRQAARAAWESEWRAEVNFKKFCTLLEDHAR
ncbi:MAG: glycosyltransferase [Bacteroidales bacterium]|nr:glycosyltransferase [Bacteroidales bacterium]